MRYRRSPKSATRTWTLKCLVLFALSVLAALPAWSQVSSTLSASSTFRPHTPRAVQEGTATLVGHYNPNQMLRLTLGLQPSLNSDCVERAPTLLLV
jgi:hypothetical protein